MTTAEAAFKQRFRLERRDGLVHQGAAADPASGGSSVSEQALTTLAREGSAAYQRAQGTVQAKTALSKATPPPLQQGQARTNSGTGERSQGAQTDRTTGREGNAR